MENRKSNMEEEHVPVGEAPEGTRPAEAGSVPSEGTKTENRPNGWLKIVGVPEPAIRDISS